jgi:hypothetical protein
LTCGNTGFATIYAFFTFWDTIFVAGFASFWAAFTFFNATLTWFYVMRHGFLPFLQLVKIPLSEYKFKIFAFYLTSAN